MKRNNEIKNNWKIWTQTPSVGFRTPLKNQITPLWGARVTLNLWPKRWIALLAPAYHPTSRTNFITLCKCGL